MEYPSSRILAQMPSAARSPPTYSSSRLCQWLRREPGWGEMV